MTTLSRKAAAVLLSALLPLLAASPALAQADKPLPPVLDPGALDKTAAPCADFFQYACGTWVRDNPVPADESVWYRFSELDEHTLAVLRAILAEDAAEKTPKSEDARKVGAYYAACMDEPGIEAKGTAPLAPELSRIAALTDKAQLPAELARLQSLGAPALFSFYPTQDYTDATRMIASADQGGLSLPDRAYYLKTDPKSVEIRQHFVQHMKNMFQLAGDPPEAAAAKAQAALDLETMIPDQSPFAGPLPRERHAPKHAGIRKGIRVQSRPAHGQPKRLPRLVRVGAGHRQVQRMSISLFARARDNDIRRLGTEGEGDVDESGALAILIGDADPVMAGRDVENHVALGGFSRLDGDQITHPLRHLIAVADLPIGIAVVVLDGEVGNNGLVAAAIAGAHADQKKTVLGDTGAGPLAELHQPPGFENRVDEVADLHLFAHGMRARRNDRAGRKRGSGTGTQHHGDGNSR